MIECILGLGKPSYEKINAGEYYAEALKGENWCLMAVGIYKQIFHIGRK